MTLRCYWRETLLNAPSLESELCPFCHALATNRHHIVPKGMGGTSREEGPTVCVCGNGNASGCHRKLHDSRIHMRYVGSPKHGHWEYVEFDEPVDLATLIANEESYEWRTAHGVDRYWLPMVGRAALGGRR